MSRITCFIVLLIAFAWKFLSYIKLYPTEEFRAISLALAGLVVPFMLLMAWYLALFVLDRSGLNVDNVKFRLLETIWVAIVLERLKNSIIEGGHLLMITDGIFLFFMFALLIGCRRRIIDSFNKIFECYEDGIVAEFGLSNGLLPNLASVKTRITIFLLGSLMLVFIF